MLYKLTYWGSSYVYMSITSIWWLNTRHVLQWYTTVNLIHVYVKDGLPWQIKKEDKYLLLSIRLIVVYRHKNPLWNSILNVKPSFDQKIVVDRMLNILKNLIWLKLNQKYYFLTRFTLRNISTLMVDRLFRLCIHSSQRIHMLHGPVKPCACGASYAEELRSLKGY